MYLAASADDWSGTPVQTEAGAGGAQGRPEEGRQMLLKRIRLATI